jgi:hypothetical protein
MTPRPRTLIVGAGLAAAAVVLPAAPAAADPPAPGDYSSEVTAIEPAVDTVTIEVVGGDSFLLLEVEPGTEVVVIGYDDEPFVRVQADGTVEQNQSSTATYLNDDRYAEVTIPERLAGVDASELEPEWEQVGTGGTYAWHDHRIHWMAPNAPPAVGRGGTFEWSGPVPLLVDGERVEVSGRIRYHEAVSPLPWIAGGLVAAAALGYALRGRSRASAAVAAAVAAVATLVAWGTWDAAPSGVGASSLPLVVAGLAVVLSVASLAAPERIRPVLLLAVTAILGAWGLLRFGVLTNPVLPTDLPFAVDRAATVAAIAVAIAVGVSAMSAMAPPPPSTAEP